MGWKAEPKEEDGYPKPNGKPVPGPKGGKGKTTKAGYYIPTEEEYRIRFPDLPKDKDVSSENIRLQAWVNPSVRFLGPATKETAAEIGSLGGQATAANREARALERERRSYMIDSIKEQLSDAELERLKPRHIIQSMMEDAYMNNDKALAVTLAKELMPYTEAKKTENKNIDVSAGTGKATDEEIKAYLNGDMSDEEFDKCVKGKDS